MNRILIYILFFVTLPFLVDAQVLSDSILLDEVEIIHKKEVIHSVGSRLDVIEMKTINNSISDSFSDFLQNRSTIYVKKYGALSTPSFRGTSASHTLFLWNGIPITSPTTSQTDLRLIPTSTFENINISYGGNSSVFGSSSLGGSIHLNNIPDYQRSIKANISSEIGNFGKFNYSSKFSYSDKKINVSSTFNKIRDQNKFPYQYRGETVYNKHALVEGVNITSNINYLLDEKSELEFNYWYSNFFREIPGNVTVDNSTSEQKDKTNRLLLSVDRNYKNISFILKNAFFRENFNYDDSVKNIHSYYQSDSYLSELDANLKFKSIHFNSSQLFKLNNSDNSSYSDLNKRDFTFSSSESISYRGELLVSEFSIRQEISTYHSLIFIPSYSTQYKHRNLTIRGRINENFRSPSFNDRFWIGVGANGDVNLKAETALNKEIGLDYNSENVIHKITFFSLYVDNWIMWRQQESGNWIPENIKEVHSRGIEWKSVYKNDIFFHELNYQYNLSTNQKGINNLDASVGKQLIYTPIHKANFTSVYNIKNFKLLLNQSFNGKVYTSSDNLNFLDHNYIVNTTIKYHIKGIKSDVSLIVNNIGNTEYQTYQNYPNSGREFIFKLNININ